ncbi:MAG: amidase [Bryobacteraceae bacterium]|nr:amidase [Bryobacteraceae bacterium]
MAEPGNDIFFSTVTELSTRLRAREFSAVELARAFSDRVERLGPRYNALALSLRETGIRQAKEVDGDLKRGRVRGVLQGIPYGAKDLLAIKGQITTWGAKPYAAQIFDFDATVITRLTKAGAVCSAKLAMVQLAGGGGYRYPAASLFGPGRNPWDTSRWAGGSSSGSGSAVAAGLVPFALGSETSGSILTPSAFCGVTGLRPTYGLISRYGAMPLSWTLDKLGPMCRSAEDCGHVLAAIAGADEKDPASAGKSFYFAPQYQRPLNTLRFGYHPADFDSWAEPETRGAFRSALETVTGMGAKLVEVQMEDMPYGAAVSTVIAAEAASVFEELIESGNVDDLADAKQAAGLKAGLDVPARDYLRAMRMRRLVQAEFRRMMTDCDLLIAPSRFGIAPKVSEPLDRGGASAPAAPRPPTGMRALIPAGNLAGLPALSLPCGFVSGLPIALQLVGRPWSENLLISVGMQFQKTTDFHKQRPKV